MQTTLPGSWVDNATSLDDIGPDRYRMQIPTERYTSAEFAAVERESIWLKTWQVAGRVDELATPGDWKQYRILDQSFIVVRGKDDKIRGFVNACRHRGNLLCPEARGNTKRNFLCNYHLWSYDLQGKLTGMLREDLAGPIDKDTHGLIEVPVDTFAGFIFLNPDPDAAPLSEFIGDEIATMLAPYHLDEMVTVMDVTERIDCNWKVVMDAFQEGYHINGIHPQLLRVINIDPATTRYRFFDRHSVAVAPFDVVGATPADQVEGTMALPDTFPSTAAVLPRFKELVAQYESPDGALTFPEGVTARTLLQQATRDTLTGMGLDVSGLTDAQMSDSHGWVLFPNFFMTIRAGECHIIMALPDPDGDPHRCVWHVASYMYLPEEYKASFVAEPIVVDEPGSYKYFEALQQDYDQMPRQQAGLRNSMLNYMALVKEEVVIAHFHSVVDNCIAAMSGNSNHRGEG